MVRNYLEIALLALVCALGSPPATAQDSSQNSPDVEILLFPPDIVDREIATNVARSRISSTARNRFSYPTWIWWVMPDFSYRDGQCMAHVLVVIVKRAATESGVAIDFGVGTGPASRSFSTVPVASEKDCHDSTVNTIASAVRSVSDIASK